MKSRKEQMMCVRYMSKHCLHAQHVFHTCLANALGGTRHTLAKAREIVRIALVRAPAGWHTPACAAAVMETMVEYSNTKNKTSPSARAVFMRWGSCPGPR